MAYCGKCGTQLSEGVKFCPKCGEEIIKNCGNELNEREKFCPKCGAQMSNKAKFCPKCGHHFEKYAVNETNSTVSNDILTSNPQNRNSGSNWILKGFFLVVIIGVCLIIGISNGWFDDNKSNTEIRTETREESTIQIDEPKQEEKPSMQNDEEFKQKTMEYVNQVQQVMVEMNNVFNSGRAFASSDLLDLKIKGDNIFDKMISLARQKKYQEAIDAFKQEKKNFDDQWHEMDKILNRDMYN